MCHPTAPTGATKPNVATREVRISLPTDEAMPTFLAEAPSPPRGFVLVAGDIFGARSPFYEHLATLLAHAGFDAAVPEFFFRQGPLDSLSQEAAFARRARLDENQTLRDLVAVIDWARARTRFSGARVGTLGFCMGGTFVLDLAAVRQDLVTACYYGFPARPPGPVTELTAPRPLDQIDHIAGPILGFWGEQDERVGLENVHELASALHARGVEFECTMYPGLGHGFLSAGFESGSPGQDEARTSWARTLEFLGAHLEAKAGVHDSRTQ
jgi:dienelactone hydrolase